MNQSSNIEERLKNTGFLLLVDSPVGIELGVDNISWQTGPKFKGIKLIPFGAHLVFYTLPSENNMFKQGFYIHLSPQNRVQVKRWNNEVQDFLPLNDKEDEERYQYGVMNMDFDQYLGPYPVDRYTQWNEVSNYITEKIITKIQALKEEVYRGFNSEIPIQDIPQLSLDIEEENEEDQDQDQDQDQQQLKQLEQLLQQQVSNHQQGDYIGIEGEKQSINKSQTEKTSSNHKQTNNTQFKRRKFNKKQQSNNSNSLVNFQKQEQIIGENIQTKSLKRQLEEYTVNDLKEVNKNLCYSIIPNVRTKHRLSGRELSQLNMDKSDGLREWLEREFSGDWKEMLGEMQSSFNHFLLVENLESFEHWKQMVALLIQCEKALQDKQMVNLYIEFIPVLYGMLRQFPKDFFNDILLKDNFLSKQLKYFFFAIQENHLINKNSNLLSNNQDGGSLQNNNSDINNININTNTNINNENENIRDDKSYKLLLSRSNKLKRFLSEHFLFVVDNEASNVIYHQQTNQYQFQDNQDDDPIIVDLEQPYYY